jgi:hypothetical protein
MIGGVGSVRGLTVMIATEGIFVWCAAVTKKTQGFVGFHRPRLLVLLSHAPCPCS